MLVPPNGVTTVDTSQKYLLHVELNGRREHGCILVGRHEALEQLFADVTRHQQEGWLVEEFHERHTSGFVMKRESSTRRVWAERQRAADAPTADRADIRQSLADGFRYPATSIAIRETTLGLGEDP